MAEQSEIYLPKIDDKLDCYFVSRLARGLTRLNQQPEPSFHSFMEQSTIQLHKSGAFEAYLAQVSKTSKLDKVSPFPIYFQKYRNAGERPDGKAARGTIDSNVEEALQHLLTIIIDETRGDKASISEICNLMNVVGRLRGLNLNVFFRCIDLLEEKLVDNS